MDGKKFHAEVKIAPENPAHLGVGGQINIQPAPGYRETLRARFLRPATVVNGLQQGLEAVLVRKESAGIIDALREIEPDLQDVKLGAEGKIYADITGMGRLVPINIMGDGVIKILAILVAILEMKESTDLSCRPEEDCQLTGSWCSKRVLGPRPRLFRGHQAVSPEAFRRLRPCDFNRETPA